MDCIIYRSMVGRPTLRAEEELLDNMTLNDVMVGDEASANRRALEIKYPVENGIIRNWEDVSLLNLFFCTTLYAFRGRGAGAVLHGGYV